MEQKISFSKFYSEMLANVDMMYTVRHLRGSLTSSYCCQSCCFLAPSGVDSQTEAHLAHFAQESVCFVIFNQDLQQSVQILKRSEQQFVIFILHLGAEYTLKKLRFSLDSGQTSWLDTGF
jgi:hypothetical protein